MSKLIMNEKKLAIPFTESSAKLILESWGHEKGMEIKFIHDMIRWDYTETPFYSTEAFIIKYGFPESARFQIYHDGTVTMFKE
jgi:hypothetical protein